MLQMIRVVTIFAFFGQAAAAIALLQTTAATETPWWAGLGIGGILAGTIAHFYRQDRTASEGRLLEQMERQRERYEVLLATAQTDRQDIVRLYETLSQTLVDNARATNALAHILQTRPCLVHDDAAIRETLNPPPRK